MWNYFFSHLKDEEQSIFMSYQVLHAMWQDIFCPPGFSTDITYDLIVVKSFMEQKKVAFLKLYAFLYKNFAFNYFSSLQIRGLAGPGKTFELYFMQMYLLVVSLKVIRLAWNLYLYLIVKQIANFLIFIFKLIPPDRHQIHQRFFTLDMGFFQVPTFFITYWFVNNTAVLLHSAVPPG